MRYNINWVYIVQDYKGDVWECKECGSMIYTWNLHEWYLAEHFCPECGAVLDAQPGFDDLEYERKCLHA